MTYIRAWIMDIRRQSATKEVPSKEMPKAQAMSFAGRIEIPKEDVWLGWFWVLLLGSSVFYYIRVQLYWRNYYFKSIFFQVNVFYSIENYGVLVTVRFCSPFVVLTLDYSWQLRSTVDFSTLFTTSKHAGHPWGAAYVMSSWWSHTTSYRSCNIFSYFAITCNRFTDSSSAWNGMKMLVNTRPKTPALTSIAL